MSIAVHLDPERRHDFVLLFDVHDGNPNGDPDAGNLPRVDPETMQGLVTDVSIKRRVRNWVDATRGQEERMKIFVQNKGIALNDLQARAYTAIGKPPTSKPDRETLEAVRAWMCENFYDIRTFGAVMTTQVNTGQVRGPVQLTFARSIDPVVPLDLSITRVAVTRPEDAQVVEGEGDREGGKVTEMGRKAILPYALFRAFGFVNPTFARQTGFDSQDLEVFWEALIRGWELDRSASRGLMACRGLYVFSHDHPLGKAPAHELFERVRIRRREGVQVARSISDYVIEVDDQGLPEGVHLTRLVG